MRYYHGSEIKEGCNIDVDGFQPVNVNANCEDGNKGLFFTTNFKYASLYAGNGGEVWFLDTEIEEHRELINSLQIHSNKCTNPDWTGYFNEEEIVDEYLINWNIITGFIPMDENGDFCVMEAERP